MRRRKNLPFCTLHVRQNNRRHSLFLAKANPFFHKFMRNVLRFFSSSLKLEMSVHVQTDKKKKKSGAKWFINMFFFLFLSVFRHENENGRDIFLTKEKELKKIFPKNILLQLFCYWLMDGSKEEIFSFSDSEDEEEAFSSWSTTKSRQRWVWTIFIPVFFQF